MDASRFDRLSMALARRVSRRVALRSGGAGIAAAALATPQRSAITATQVASPAATDEPAVSFLFVQIASSGSLQPQAGVADAEHEFVLTLDAHAGNTVYFSDRPERLTGAAPTPHVFDLVFGTGVAPNAALVVDLPQQREAVFVLTLTNPRYDVTAQALTYEADILEEYEGEALTPLVAKQAARPVDPGAGLTFGPASLFIDTAVLGDCPNTTYTCCGGTYCDQIGHQKSVGTISVGTCIKSLCIDPCDSSTLQSQCNQTYAAACQAADRGYCEADCCGCPSCA